MNKLIGLSLESDILREKKTLSFTIFCSPFSAVDAELKTQMSIRS